MFYVVCGIYKGLEYPAFYVSNESKRTGNSWEWKLGLMSERKSAKDVWYFGSLDEARAVALQLEIDKVFSLPNYFRQKPQVVELKTK